MQDIAFTEKRVYLVLNFLDRLTLCLWTQRNCSIEDSNTILIIILTTHSLLSYLKYLPVLGGVMAQMDVY